MNENTLLARRWIDVHPKAANTRVVTKATCDETIVESKATRILPPSSQSCAADRCGQSGFSRDLGLMAARRGVSNLQHAVAESISARGFATETELARVRLFRLGPLTPSPTIEIQVV